MDTGEEKLITNGLLIGALVIFVVKPVLNTLGVSDEDRQKVADQGATTPAENPFSPNFNPFLQYWQNSQPAGLSVADGMAQIYEGFEAGTLDRNSQAFLIASWADTLDSALSVWNWSVDTNAVFSVFNQMTSQTQCAALAAYVGYVYGKDLFHWLHYGGSAIPFIPNGLSESQVAIIIDEVNNLPE